MDFEDERVSTSTAFLLWFACVFGLCGVHRFYMGKWFTGFLYLISFGFLGVGQIIDLLRLRGMVQDENDKRRLIGARERRYLASGRRQIGDGFDPPAQKPTIESIRMKLLSAAAARGGKLSVTEGVMATGNSFAEVEAELDVMAKSGYVGLDVDEETGRVTYAFGELSK